MSSTPSAPTPPVSLIGGGPGAWDLITVRGMHRLQAADVIIADHLGPTAELDKLSSTQPTCPTENKSPRKKSTPTSLITPGPAAP